MCGIVGIASSYTNGMNDAECNMFRDMLFVDSLRGMDSTGVFSVNQAGTVEMHKDALTGPDFICTKEYKEFRQGLWSRGLFAVGHNRAATRGAVTDKNAHPFCIDDKIVLVQNGTYFGSHKHHKDVEVDTEAVAHVMAENEDISSALQKINAAYALVWYDVKKESLHIIRNEQRPLYLAQEKGKAGWIWASEDTTIKWAAERNKITLEAPPVMLPPGVLITLHKSKNHFEYSEEPIDAKFRYVPHRAPDGKFSPGFNLALGEDSEYPFVQETTTSTKPPYSQTQVHSSIVNPNDIRRSIHDILISLHPETWLGNGEGLPLMNLWRDTTKTAGNRGCVELVDCFPTNSHHNCTSWWVVGKWIRTDNKLDGVIVYWLVNNKSKDQITDYVTEDYYMVTFNELMYKKFKVYNQDYAIVLSQGTNPVPYTQPTTMDTQHAG